MSDGSHPVARTTRQAAGVTLREGLGQVFEGDAMCKELCEEGGESCQDCGKLICFDVKNGDDILRPAFVTSSGDVFCDRCGRQQEREDQEEEENECDFDDFDYGEALG